MRIRVRALEPGMTCFDDISGEEIVVIRKTGIDYHKPIRGLYKREIQLYSK